MGDRETTVAIALLACILLPGCASPEVRGAAGEGRHAAAMDGDEVLAKFMENREQNRFGDYKAEGVAGAAVYVNGALLGNATVSGQANVSAESLGHAVFDIALSSPQAAKSLRQEYYLAGGRLFTQSGGGWVERSLPAGTPDVFNSQPDLAVSSLNWSALREVGGEDVRGVPCYVLTGPWDPSEAVAFAAAMAGGSVPSARAVTEADYQAAGGSVTLWISTDRYMLMRHERTAEIIVRNVSRVDAREVMTYYDQGVPNSIDLPPALLQR